MSVNKSRDTGDTGEPRIDMSRSIMARGQVEPDESVEGEIRSLGVELERKLTTHRGEEGLVALRERAMKGDDWANAIVQSIDALRHRIRILSLRVSSSMEAVPDITGTITDADLPDEQD